MTLSKYNPEIIMAESSLSNFYNITEHSITRLSQAQVRDLYFRRSSDGARTLSYPVSEDSKDFPSCFYLNVKFNNKQDFYHFDEYISSVTDELEIKNKIYNDWFENTLSIPFPLTENARMYVAADPEKTEKLINFLNDKCQYNFKEKLDKSKLEHRDFVPWVQSKQDLISNVVCVSIAMSIAISLYFGTAVVFAIFMMSVAALHIGGMCVSKARDRFIESCNKEYLDKDSKALEDLSDSHKNSFDLGVQAANSFLVQFKSCFNPDGLKHPKAFYAGMMANEIDSPLERDLMGKLKTSC